MQLYNVGNPGRLKAVINLTFNFVLFIQATFKEN